MVLPSHSTYRISLNQIIKQWIAQKTHPIKSGKSADSKTPPSAQWCWKMRRISKKKNVIGIPSLELGLNLGLKLHGSPRHLGIGRKPSCWHKRCWYLEGTEGEYLKREFKSPPPQWRETAYPGSHPFNKKYAELLLNMTTSIIPHWGSKKTPFAKKTWLKFQNLQEGDPNLPNGGKKNTKHMNGVCWCM